MSQQNFSQSITSSLLQGARNGEQDAWKRLFELFHPFVYGWLRRWGVPEADAPDLTQNVFTSVYTALPDFDYQSPDATFRGWLWRIARNAANHYFSSRRPVQLDSNRLNAIPEVPDEESCADERVLLLHKVLDLVSRDFQERTVELFRKSVLEGRATDDLAVEYGMKKSTIREAKRRVLSRLREEFVSLAGKELWSSFSISKEC
jgi:RNA polymerase sigma-70 factor (ECF subfamily)